ncbi:unnamed protein product [Linum trigynum]|uniref:FAD-binding PCMH-type domain-containing protein n=1 Tax=Linum trigynum TaxID=586398 RepID=A0AAV2CHN9_9ROSI
MAPNNTLFLHSLLLLCFSSLHIHTSLSLPPTAADVRFLLSSCFLQNQIHNFTTFPSSTTDDPSATTSFYNLLDYSIQNLRFQGPNTPKPLAIVLPSTAEQLVGVVTCCRGKAEIKVRCGGHSYEGASSAWDGGEFVIVDLMRLNAVSVDSRSETAWVEGGATLGETYAAVAEGSDGRLGFSAGSCPTVGVGGHIGGGGYGLLSRRYGMAADNVVDALLVDAGGRLLDRLSMGEDVFWAIRGGGGGAWGIVYAWKIKLLKVPTKVTAFAVSRQPAAQNGVSKLVNKWQHVAPKLEPDFYLSCFVGAGLPGAQQAHQISATFKGLYLGPKSEALSTLGRDFPELGLGENECEEMSWIESVVFFSGLNPGSSVADLKERYLEDKHYFKAKSDYVRSEIPMKGIELAVEILEREPKGYVILDPYGGVMSNFSEDSIAFPHRKGNLFTIQYLVEWGEEDGDNSEGYLGWIREFYELMTPFVSSNPRRAYVNYLDFDLGVVGSEEEEEEEGGVEVARVWGEKYFLGNFDRLVMAKTIIDSDNVFNHPQSIPPLSSSSIGFRDDI